MKTLINDKEVLSVAKSVLGSGGLVMHPTETCYGLAVDVFNEEAVKKLYEVKRMDESKPVSVLVSGLGMALEYGVFSDRALELAQEHWPGPLSILVPRARALPEFVNRGNEFVSLRFSSLEFCSEMVRELGRPVTTTSANVSGEEAAYVAVEIEGVDLLIDGGEIAQNKPSTIVRVAGDGLEILRQGSVIL